MSKIMCRVWQKKNLPPPGQLVRLARQDGTADLGWDSNGVLHRLGGQKLSKAENKRAKRIRQAMRREKVAAVTA